MAKQLSKYDTLLYVHIIPNDKIFAVVNSQSSLLEAFKRVNDVLKTVVQGISYMLVKPGLVNVDFADMKTVLKEKGFAKMGTGVVSKKIGCVREAAISALGNPLTEELSPSDSQSILVNIVGGLSLSINDIEEIGSLIKVHFNQDATIILGTAVDNELTDEIRVTIVATGYERQNYSNSTFQWTATKKSDDSELVKRKIRNEDELRDIPSYISSSKFD